ncbi:grpE protein homolog, mitochondrial [Anopheles ziemanni]|uniref:grpE protein homolog, mitochondrial n=1 Tax=Anopheles coustani TaxID=139045 RepID=UPI00265949F6|nr:grpE protein homolog, mitochondrial [Anopheles coustani]XP_058172267.1 grpE protein homolog, mitochondrial [Anopheles ziemanni]
MHRSKTALSLLQKVDRLRTTTGTTTLVSRMHTVYVQHPSQTRLAWTLYTDRSGTSLNRREFSTTDTARVEEPTENEKKLSQEVEDLRKEAAELTEKVKSLDDKYKRALAESENIRRRLTKQIDDAKLFGIQGFCKDLLDVADILGHATEAVPKEEVSEKNPHLKNLFEGLSMTRQQLNSVFKRHGLEAVNPLNEKFNPNLHEALFQQEVANVEPNTVVVVSKIGYKLHDRCIRPALVGVAKG